MNSSTSRGTRGRATGAGATSLADLAWSLGDTDPDLALQACAKVVSRFAWRLSDATANVQQITLKLFEGRDPEGTLRGQWQLSSLAAQHMALADLLAGSYSLLKGELIFFAVVHLFILEPWRQISLEHPMRRSIVHEYRIHDPEAPLTGGVAT